MVLIDEVHMIGETDRGGTLESVISRMKTIQRAACVKSLSTNEIASSSYKNTTPEALTSNMRIVAVSATLPNLGQLGRPKEPKVDPKSEPRRNEKREEK